MLNLAQPFSRCSEWKGGNGEINLLEEKANVCFFQVFFSPKLNVVEAVNTNQKAKYIWRKCLLIKE